MSFHGRSGASAAADDARAEHREAEPGKAVAPRARDEQHGEPEAGDRASEAREVDHLTVTTARSEWRCAVTTSTYRPGCFGARSLSTGPCAKPWRLPSSQP